jgi:prolyl oligopeptidase
MFKYFLSLIMTTVLLQDLNAQEDKFQWLEEVEGQRALEFVNQQNKLSAEKLMKLPSYQPVYEKSLEILNSTDKIAYPSILGNHVYNFWKDKDHVRGIWRRCLLSDYVAGKPSWETLIDIDQLSQQDNEKWVFKQANGLHPTYDRFLIHLSKGGGDAIVVKEFVVTKKQFVDNGFFVPESKGGADFLDMNTVVVSSDFGAGTMTSSGYPRQTRIWKRGTALKDAQLIHEAASTDIGAWGGTMRDGDQRYTYINQWMTTFSSNKVFWIDGKITVLDIPQDTDFKGILSKQAIVQLRSDWTVDGKKYVTGSLLSLDFPALLKGQKKVSVILVPDANSSISDVSITKNFLLVNTLTNVTGQLHAYAFNNGTWQSKKVPVPELGTVSVDAVDEASDQYFFTFANFITPPTLYSANAATASIQKVKSLPAYFDASKYEVKQYKAKSKDGTMVPYFVVASKQVKADGTNPTLIYAYGGFEISQTPSYISVYGTAWLDKGGVYVLANIRGGGEFGPQWHQQGLLEKRQNVYDDFYAVSEDLIAKKLTSPKHLGIYGGSNGGLLVGVAFTQRPDLYNAVVCAVPLLDMYRYNKLLAGASWMGEYGNPDKPEDWAFIQKYSPYQNLKAGVKYPEVFFYTSTKDDRVHPGHARKMAAKMIDMGYPVLYYENTEGGHAGSSTNEQRAKLNGMMFSYLLQQLK